MGRVIACVITLLLLCGSVQSATNINSTQSELSQVDQRIGELLSDISSSELKRQKIHQEIEQTDQHIAEQSSKLETINVHLLTQKEHIQSLKQQRQQQQNILQKEQAILAKQLRAAHIIGHQEKMKLLLNQQNAATFNRTLIYYDYLSRARSEHIATVKQSLETLADTKKIISQEETDLLMLKVKAENERSLLASSRLKRKSLILYLDEKIQNKDIQVKELKKDKKALKGLLTKLIKASELAAKKAAQEAADKVKKEKAALDRKVRLAKQKKDKAEQARLAKEKRKLKQLAAKAVAKKSSFRARKGHFFWPTTGTLTSRFGSSKASGLASDGVIISSQAGGKVQAIHAGRVVFSEWLRGFGLLIIIDHGKGYMSLYGHNDKLLKKVNDQVELNTPIATIGNSGGLKESGLYFGIRYNGKPLNPKKWCHKIRGNKVK